MRQPEGETQTIRGLGLTQLSEMLLQLFFQVVGGTSDVGRNHFIVGDDGISPERTKLCLRVLRTCSLEQCIAMVQGEIRKDDPRATSGALVPIRCGRRLSGSCTCDSAPDMAGADAGAPALARDDLSERGAVSILAWRAAGCAIFATAPGACVPIFAAGCETAAGVAGVPDAPPSCLAETSLARRRRRGPCLGRLGRFGQAHPQLLFDWPELLFQFPAQDALVLGVLPLILRS